MCCVCMYVMDVCMCVWVCSKPKNSNFGQSNKNKQTATFLLKRYRRLNINSINNNMRLQHHYSFVRNTEGGNAWNLCLCSALQGCLMFVFITMNAFTYNMLKMMRNESKIKTFWNTKDDEWRECERVITDY